MQPILTMLFALTSTSAPIMIDGHTAVISVDACIEKNRVTPSCKQALRHLVVLLRPFRSPGLGALIIEGHTNRQDSEEQELAESERVARVIRDFLIGSGGLMGERVRTLAYGSERPMSLNEKDPVNRRVEIPLQLGVEHRMPIVEPASDRSFK